MLNWEVFKTLSGSPEANFEKLWRAVVLRNFGSFGSIWARKNHPGVEFVLELSKDCVTLGGKGERIGWQCKWFNCSKARNLLSSEKKQIVDSLNKTVQHESNLNVWILCIRHPMTHKDLEWYAGLQERYSFKLKVWNESELDNFLNGPALELRQTFFGELALTRSMLAVQHEISISPIRSRWMEAVHQQSSTEKEILQILGEPSSYESVRQIINKLSKLVLEIDRVKSRKEYLRWSDAIGKLSNRIKQYIEISPLLEKCVTPEILSTLDGLISSGDESSRNIHLLGMQLGTSNLGLAPIVSNAIVYIQQIKRFISELSIDFQGRFIAVEASAGAGKTQMSIELTKPTKTRPAGILILGRDLGKGDNLDSLAQTIKFNNKKVETFELLLAALDAVALRENCRLPLVIDGLNEAEVPQKWQSLLLTAQTLVERYPNIVLVCTLRVPNTHTGQDFESEAKNALPEQIKLLDLDDFDESFNTELILKYLSHYKIAMPLEWQVINFLKTPLNLRLFCELTNRDAERSVTATYFPSSQTKLFEKQIDHVVQNIYQTGQYCKEELYDALYYVGQLLLESGKRFINESDFYRIWEKDHDKVSKWQNKILYMFVKEGLFLRDKVKDQQINYVIRPVYDRFGGYLIANYLLSKNLTKEVSSWINSPEVIDKVFNYWHQLSDDTIRALITLVPYKCRKTQVWSSLSFNSFKERALSYSHLIDKDDFDSDTREAYKQYVYISLNNNSYSVFSTLTNLALLVNHPLNADFLDELLRGLPLVERDLYWTEFVRQNQDKFENFIDNLYESWRQKKDFSVDFERLKGILISWVLTTTNIRLRDNTTRALMHFGLQFPDQLFKITMRSLGIDDLYVAERLISACYPVVFQLTSNNRESESVRDFANFLYSMIFPKNAKYPTTHLLMRDYAARIVRICVEKGILSNASIITKCISVPFPEMPRQNAWGQILEKDPEYSLVKDSLMMDFRNYIVGRLVEGRVNYDDEHPVYRELLGKILWRVWQLGWSDKRFSTIDEQISKNNWNRIRTDNKTERYGKKYSWVAYFELVGQLLDEGKLSVPEGDLRFTVDIDPFSPIALLESNLSENELFEGPTSTQAWILSGMSQIWDDVLAPRKFDESGDKWICVYATDFINSNQRGRSLMNEFIGVCCESEDVNYLQGQSEQCKALIHSNISNSHYFIYCGEIYADEQASAMLNIASEFSFKFEQKSICVHKVAMTYHWEEASVDPPLFSGELLTPYFMKFLNLKFDPINVQYLDSQDKIAVKMMKLTGEIRTNHAYRVYVRKDILDSALKTNCMSLVFLAWGEKGLSFKRRSLDSKENSYKEYEEMFVYHPNKR